MQRLLVTGGNKGIGFAIVNAILSQHQDTFVLLGSRDARRGEQARQQLLAAHADWAARLEVLELDVSSDASVAAAAGRVRERFQNEQTPLSALVNNAGIGGSAGLRAVLEVNTFGVRRACEAFLPLLDPQSGRIVNVTSAAGPSFVATCSADSGSSMPWLRSVVGTLWSTTASVFSGLRTLRPVMRKPSKACGLVTSCTKWRSI